MKLTVEQERQIEFINDEISATIGGLDFLKTLVNKELADVHEHSAIQVMDNLRLAQDHLIAARLLSRNVIDGYYEAIIKNAKAPA